MRLLPKHYAASSAVTPGEALRAPRAEILAAITCATALALLI
jgi:hypothetical protein